MVDILSMRKLMPRDIRKLFYSQKVVVLEFKPLVTPNTCAFLYNTAPSFTCCYSYTKSSSSYKNEWDYKGECYGKRALGTSHCNFIIFRKRESRSSEGEHKRQRKDKIVLQKQR